MHGYKLLHKLLLKSLKIHAKRINAIVNATQALLIGKQLTVTQLGRFCASKAKEKHNIRKMDRLIGNEQLQKESFLFYQMISRWLLSGNKQPIINIDWSATDKRKDWHILRASVAAKGRSFTLYQEIHSEDFLNSPKAQKEFLQKIKALLPANVFPILITDAGFCNPWFKEIKRLGYHWIGRTSATVQYTEETQENWKKCSDLYPKATKKPQEIGKVLLAKTNALQCRLVLYKEGLKGRINKTRGGKKCENTHSQRIAKRQRTPWVLATSLSSAMFSAEQIVRCYKKRMQIEEDFRDTKSIRYGFSLRHCLSKSAERIQILLLFAVFANFVCWLLSLTAQAKNQHYDYQANTERKNTVLSVIYLGCQLARKKASITYQEGKLALKQLQFIIRQAAI